MPVGNRRDRALRLRRRGRARLKLTPQRLALRARSFQFGAKPARASKAVLNPGGAEERALTSKVAGVRLQRGDLLSVEFAGGGGWGDPHQREIGRVREDVARGYVSRASARDDYGVALDADLAVDDAATAQLRGEKTAR